jgi:hypothetical protein
VNRARRSVSACDQSYYAALTIIKEFDGVEITSKPKWSSRANRPTMRAFNAQSSSWPGLVEAHGWLAEENKELRGRLDQMEGAMGTLGRLVEALRHRVGVLEGSQNVVRPTTSRIRFPFESASIQGAGVEPPSEDAGGPSVPPSESSNNPGRTLSRSRTSTSPSVPPQSALLVSGSPVESPPDSTSPISPLGNEGSVPQIVVSLPEVGGTTEAPSPLRASSPEDAGQCTVASQVPIGLSFGSCAPPPLFPIHRNTKGERFSSFRIAHDSNSPIQQLRTQMMCI